MKKTSTLCIIAVIFIINNTFSQSPASMEGLLSTTACDSLQTTYIGGNSQKGVMFDITAVSINGDITIKTFDVDIQGDCEFRVYFHGGSYVGYENSPADWVSVAYIDTLHAHPVGTPTPVHLSTPVTIPSGQTYSFYLTATNTTTINLIYTNGTSVGTVFAQDANIFVHEGCGIQYPFTGTPYTPRKFNGRVRYCYTPLGISEEAAGTISSKVSPNPFSNSTIISFEGRIIKDYSLKIFDLVGNFVKEINNISAQEVTVDKGNMTSGMYFYKLINKNEVAGSGKFIVD